MKFKNVIKDKFKLFITELFTFWSKKKTSEMLNGILNNI